MWRTAIVVAMAVLAGCGGSDETTPTPEGWYRYPFTPAPENRPKGLQCPSLRCTCDITETDTGREQKAAPFWTSSVCGYTDEEILRQSDWACRYGLRGMEYEHITCSCRDCALGPEGEPT